MLTERGLEWCAEVHVSPAQPSCLPVVAVAAASRQDSVHEDTPPRCKVHCPVESSNGETVTSLATEPSGIYKIDVSTVSVSALMPVYHLCIP